jgi:aspartate-semialdehyde dehydrogenase
MASLRDYNVAVIGATGNAGNNTLKILAERKFPVNEVFAVASKRSVGKKVSFKNRDLEVQSFDSVDFSKVDLAIFCAGSEFSKKYAKQVTEAGCIIIDKSSYFRFNPKVPLIVPEVNAKILEKGAPLGIISTPNCVAVPLSMTIKALMGVAPVKRVVVSTYQAVSGAGKAASDELYNQTKSVVSSGEVVTDVFSKQIAFNAIPVIGNLYESGVSEEEDKIACEICKLLKSDVRVAVTCVRVPTFIGHGMSVSCEFSKEISLEDAYHAFDNFEGILVVDRKEENVVATPLDAQGEDAVFISRVRKDPTIKYGLMFWAVADNLRKGAALNSVQIAEHLIDIDPKLKLFKCKSR